MEGSALPATEGARGRCSAPQLPPLAATLPSLAAVLERGFSFCAGVPCCACGEGDACSACDRDSVASQRLRVRAAGALWWRNAVGSEAQARPRSPPSKACPESDAGGHRDKCNERAAWRTPLMDRETAQRGARMPRTAASFADRARGRSNNGASRNKGWRSSCGLAMSMLE